MITGTQPSASPSITAYLSAWCCHGLDSVPMRAARDVISITRLESDAAELVRQAHEEGRTIIVTRDGAARAVLESVDR
jgi:hypothetical protein